MDQHAIDLQGVIGRQQVVTAWDAVTQSAGPDADRPAAGRIGENSLSGLLAEPGNRLDGAVGRQNLITGFERLYRSFAVRRTDHRPGHKANGQSVDISRLRQVEASR
jgi:hypothetical protein